MGLNELANRIGQVFELRNLLLEPQRIQKEMFLDFQPPEVCRLLVKVFEGEEGSGQVTLIGKLDGVEKEETLDFPHHLARQSGVFSYISKITTVGFTGESPIPKLSIRSVDPDGSPLRFQVQKATDVPFRVWTERETGILEEAGEISHYVTRFATSYRGLRAGDLVSFSGETFRITRLQAEWAFGKQPPHYEGVFDHL